MSSSCFAALAKQAPKLLCADCAGLEGGGAVKKEPSLPTLPAKAAAPEPAPDRSERRPSCARPRRRQGAEAQTAALQHQLGRISESGRTLERKLQEAPAAEVRPGDATSPRARPLAQTGEARARGVEEGGLEAKLRSASAEPAAQTRVVDLEAELAGKSSQLDRTHSGREFRGPHGDLSELIAMKREICDLQDQLVREMSKRTDLQLQLDALACHRQASDQRALRRAFSETTLTTSESAESWAAGVRTPSEPASSFPGSPSPGFGGWLFVAESTPSGASPLRYATAPRTRVTASPLRSPIVASPLRRTRATATQSLPVAGIRSASQVRIGSDVVLAPTVTSGPFSPASAPHPIPPSRKPLLLSIQGSPAVLPAMDL